VGARAPRLGAYAPRQRLAICLDTHGEVGLAEIACLAGPDEAGARSADWSSPADSMSDLVAVLLDGCDRPRPERGLGARSSSGPAGAGPPGWVTLLEQRRRGLAGWAPLSAPGPRENSSCRSSSASNYAAGIVRPKGRSAAKLPLPTRVKVQARRSRRTPLGSRIGGPSRITGHESQNGRSQPVHAWLRHPQYRRP
jgi:hypothetical protein